MRKLLALAIVLLLPAALAAVQTFREIGITPTVGPLEKNRSWEIPYEFQEGCTPFASITLLSGKLTVMDGNAVLLKTKRPGTYRVVLKRSGVVRITLERLEGEGEAKIDEKSFIACDRVPVIETNIISPDVWKVGGYTGVSVVLKNTGTADANGVLLLKNPWNAAPLEPPGKITVPAGGETTIQLTMLTTKENSKVLFPGQCFEYRDKYGRAEVCTDSTTFRAEKNVPVACIIYPDTIELFNTGYVETEIKDQILLPRDSIFTGINETNGASMCEIGVKIQKSPFVEETDLSVYYSLILTLLGIIGLLVSEKRLKTSKA
ncbi:MAG: hypothetical protein PWP76_563 [Candidatus Diapherotrites archaeon]|nr:hypothetical protein [Candidatus Diapherotrites archaeon]MDN5366619.1 hypothetical protein [Candidatus Diapherotrites archaeon]